MQDSDTILGPDIRFRGRLTFQKRLIIQGEFRGTIQTGGQLHVAPGAVVEADIEAGEVSIEGSIRGNVIAAKSVALRKSGRLSGDLRAPELTVEAGSKFNGSSIMES